MQHCLSDLLLSRAETMPAAPALVEEGRCHAYGELAAAVERFARGLARCGLRRGDRVAVYLEKRWETVVACFAAAHAGAIFVPVNPLLKPRQVGHILRDCTPRLLVTSAERLRGLGAVEPTVVLVDGVGSGAAAIAWSALHDLGCGPAPLPAVIDLDPAAILYTSGSTGLPKGVVLSHRNLVAGAASVAGYLGLRWDDCVQALLPLSFDAGFSQLTTAFQAGARVALHDYLLPGEAVRAVARDEVSVLTAVPPLWMQLARQEWPANSLRLIASTGGTMPRPVLDQLRRRLPRAQVYLMYGLTEAFRSTYLPPAELDRRPGSIGKAVPNAEILVLRPDGTPCAPGEPGELVHRGAFVALGYWNDRERTARRFRPLPGGEIAVWSGDTVRTDADGFLYFLGRGDDMIKTSGYRVGPGEIEEAAHVSGLVGEAAAVGIADAELGQAVALFVAPLAVDAESLRAILRRELPAYMVPRHIVALDALPRTPNGKIDRAALKLRLDGAAEAA